MGLPASASQVGSACFSTGLTTLGVGVVLGEEFLHWIISGLKLLCRTAEAELLRVFAALTSCLSSAKDTCNGTKQIQEYYLRGLSHIIS